MEWAQVAENNQRIVSAVNKNRDPLEHAPRIDERAQKFYRWCDDHKEHFQDCHKSLELCIVNASRYYSFKFVNQHFRYGKYFVRPSPIDVHPGCAGMIYVTGGHENAPADVGGGLDYEIFSGYHLYIGFQNISNGGIKSFVAIERNMSAQWAYERCKDGACMKEASFRFKMVIREEEAKNGGDKMIQFIIFDN